MHLKKQRGVALLFALIIVAAVSILSGSIFYMIKVSIMESNAINANNDASNADFLALQRNFALLAYRYTNTPVAQTQQIYETDKNTVTVINKVDTPIAPDSLVLNNASAILQYQVSVIASNVGSTQKITYNARINTPSQYKPQQALIPQISQPVNIPVVILENLSNVQKNATNSLNSAQAGYIGDIAVDNTNHQLIYTPNPATTPDSFLLNFPSTPNNETYNLTQGWSLLNGEWILSLFIYSPNNYGYQTNISLSALLNLASDDADNAFSKLSWQLIIIPGPAEYNALKQYIQGNYVTFDSQNFVSVAAIDSGNNKDPYNNPSQWRLVIPPTVYPKWNTNIQYLKGDIITENGIQYVAIKDNPNMPPSNNWAQVLSSTATPWKSQAYNPGDLVTDSDFTFVNIKKSKANKTPLQQSKNWRVVATSSAPLAYNTNVVYTQGQIINYDNQVFVNIATTSNNPYQDKQEKWRIILPETPFPDYNPEVRYYKDDKVIFSGTTYQADVNYKQSIKPGESPEKNSKKSKWEKI